MLESDMGLTLLGFESMPILVLESHDMLKAVEWVVMGSQFILAVTSSGEHTYILLRALIYVCIYY